MNTTVQTFQPPNIDRERHCEHRHRQTDRQTDDIIVPVADHTSQSTIG